MARFTCKRIPSPFRAPHSCFIEQQDAASKKQRYHIVTDLGNLLRACKSYVHWLTPFLIAQSLKTQNQKYSSAFHSTGKMSSTSLEHKIEKLESELIHKVPLVENRVPLIQELLKTNQESSEDTPIPNVLVEEDWSQDDVANSEHFLRDVIKTVKDSDPTGWRDLLDSWTEQQGKMLEEFTNGEKIEDIYEKFDFGSSRGTRQELADWENAEKLFVPFPLVDSNLGLVTEEVNTQTANGDEGLDGQARPFAPKPQFHAMQKQVDVQLFEDAAHKKKLLVLNYVLRYTNSATDACVRHTLTQSSETGVKTFKIAPSTLLCHRPYTHVSRSSNLQQTAALVFVSLGIVSHHLDKSIRWVSRPQKRSNRSMQLQDIHGPLHLHGTKAVS